MAWPEKLPGGKWRGGWRNADGDKVYTKKATHPEHPYARRRDALDAAQEEEVKARRRAAAAKGTIAASILFEEWWGMVAPRSEDSNVAIKADSIARNYLIPKWGNVPLNGIKQRSVKAWVADLTPKKEPSYVHRIFAEFRRAMNLALEGDPPILDASPCAGVKLPSIRRKAKTFMDDDYRVKIGAVMHTAYRDLNEADLRTGLRPGEICGLHADAVDLETGWVTVRCVYVDQLHVIRGYPKDKDERKVPLVDDAIAVIRRRLEGRDLTAGCGVPHADGSRCTSVLVFLNARGRAVTPEAWKAALHRAAGRAKLPRMAPYAIRRGFATAAARGGMDAFELAEIMGHADVRQTREYVQQSPAARDRLRAALGERARLALLPGGGEGNEPATPLEHARTIRHS